LEKYWVNIILILFSPQFLLGQGIRYGKVIDAVTNQSIASASVFFDGEVKTLTSDQGEFSFEVQENGVAFYLDNNSLYYQTSSSQDIVISSINGEEIARYHLKGNGNIILANLVDGIYFIKWLNVKADVYQLTRLGGQYNLAKVKGPSENYTMKITADGYFDRVIKYKIPPKEIYLQKIDYQTKYMKRLVQSESFDILKSIPFTSSISEVSSVKLLYSIHGDVMNYFNTKLYLVHYDFVFNELDYTKGKDHFLNNEYTQTPYRNYIPATLNYYQASQKYVLEFGPYCEVSCEQIKRIYDKILETTFIPKSKLFFLDTRNENECRNDVPSITSQKLYGDQNYQPLNHKFSYGYLKKYKLKDLKNAYLDWKDIVIIDGLPLDIGVVSGIITTKFQPPLSHLNVLSYNRGTPNMGLKNGWTDAGLNKFIDKLIYFSVDQDSFVIREATLAEATQYWDTRQPKEITTLQIDTVTQGLIDLETVDHTNFPTVGGKASNFGELKNIKLNDTLIQLPLNHFAIPMYYYWQHIKQNAIDLKIRNLLKVSNQLSSSKRLEALKEIRRLIKNTSVDKTLLLLVRNEIQRSGSFSDFRFRSSSNAEDIKDFNSAGLYDSFTGSLTNLEKPIEDAIKNVWASLWNDRAFDERSFHKIDQSLVGMAILVHRNFPDEYANGIVITQNPFNKFNPANFINVQIGESSLARPEDNFIPDQILYYYFSIGRPAYEYISTSNHPEVNGSAILTMEELRKVHHYCKAIWDHYCDIKSKCFVMDIEFKVDIDRRIYIKQARQY
jgi:pyruvate, water dikinase